MRQPETTLIASFTKVIPRFLDCIKDGWRLSRDDEAITCPDQELWLSYVLLVQLGTEGKDCVEKVKYLRQPCQVP